MDLISFSMSMSMTRVYDYSSAAWHGVPEDVLFVLYTQTGDERWSSTIWRTVEKDERVGNPILLHVCM